MNTAPAFELENGDNVAATIRIMDTVVDPSATGEPQPSAGRRI